MLEFVRRAVLIGLAGLQVALCAGAQELTPADRAQGLQYLKESYAGVIGATRDLSAEQWKYKPAPDRWSIAELVEHLALAEDFALAGLAAEPAKGQSSAPVLDAKQIDARILSVMPDRTVKYQAPPEVVPTGRWTPEAALVHFTADCRQIEEILRTSPDLRRRTAFLPPIRQQADFYEFILAVAGHNERHTKQMLEVKASPGLPTK